jgi:fructose-1-phosphate kinase PfkB-like protein
MERLAAPNVTFSTLDRGGSYLVKLQQLATAIDTSIAAFNQQVDAAATAEGIKAQVQELVALAQQAVTDAKAISDSGLPNQTGKAGAVFVTNGAASAWKKTDGTEGAVVAIAAVAGLEDRLTEFEIYALGGAL